MKKSWNSPGHLFSHFRTNPVLTYALVEKKETISFENAGKSDSGIILSK